MKNVKLASSTRVKKQGKGKHAKIIACPPKMKAAIKSNRDYLAKRRAKVRKLFAKHAKTVLKLKTKGYSFNQIMGYLIADKGL